MNIKFMNVLFGIVFAIFVVSSCRLRDMISHTDSGPGGSPQQWTCDELKEQYKEYRANLADAIAAFEASKAALGADAEGNPLANPAPAASSSPTPTKSPTAADITNQIGQGPDAIPTLPTPIKNFAVLYESVSNIPGRNPVDCDDVYSKYALSKTNRIVEQCRYVVKLNNLLIVIQGEYNRGRDGECRSGKAVLQTEQVTNYFPYCINPCRFGLTACTKCEFTIGQLTSQYICGEEQDARIAVAAHCREHMCSNPTPRCTTDVFNDIAVGSTANKDSNTRVTFHENVAAQFSVEIAAGVAGKASSNTKIDASLEARVLLKNNRGAPLLSVNGGETATSYACAVTVASAVVVDVGLEVGVGVDLVVAKGGQTIKAGTSIEAATSYNSQSRDIPAAGVPISNMLAGCSMFASNWAKNDLPALLTQNIAFKTIAARYMGEKKDMYRQDITTFNTYCETDRRTAYFVDGPIKYAVNNVWWDLQEKNIGFKFRYEGTWRSYDSPVYTFTEKDSGATRYADLRKKIFAGEVSDDYIRALIEATYKQGGWLKACHVGY